MHPVTSERAEQHDVILYDGICGLCNHFVQFLIARDKADRYRFAALQSPIGRDLVLKHHGDPDAVSTVYLVENWGRASERARTRGKAALYAVNALGGAWKIPGLLRILPGFILNLGYALVARLRYRLFGRLDACPIPTAATRSKFLDQPN